MEWISRNWNMFNPLPIPPPPLSPPPRSRSAPSSTNDTVTPTSLYPSSERGHTHTHPHSQYFTRLLDLSCGPELLSHQLWPDAKELSESFACSEAVFRFIMNKVPSNTNWNGPGDKCVVCVGDGNTPRTAALFAYQLKSRNFWCYAIDPQLNLDPEADAAKHVTSTSPDTPGGTSVNSLGSTYKGIDNLMVHRGPVEEVFLNCKVCVIVMMHAHVSMDQVMNSVSKDCEYVAVVACPCCNYAEGQALFQGRPPDHQGADWGIWSDKRMMSVWNVDTGGPTNDFSETSKVEDRLGFHDHFVKPTFRVKAAKRGSANASSAAKLFVTEICDACLTWSMAANAADAYHVAMEFYRNFPKEFGVPAPAPNPSTVEEFTKRCEKLEAGQESAEIFEFVGRLSTNKNALQKMGKRLMFFTVAERTTGRPLRIKVKDNVLTGENVKGGVAGVCLNVALLSAALQAAPNFVRVTGRAALSTCGKYQVVNAASVSIKIPEPDVEVIKERLESRRTVSGMFRKEAGYYTESGALFVKEKVCDTCGWVCGGEKDYEEHKRSHECTV